MKSWKRFTGNLKFISTFFLFLLFYLSPVKISRGCGPIDISFYGYSFLNPHIVDPGAGFASFFMPFEEVFELYKGQEFLQVRDNLAEWQERFCDIPTMKDLQYIIYRASIGEMKQLRTALRSQSIPLSPRLSNNSFARYLDRNKCHETVDYLIFAKSCEPHVVKRKDWNEHPRNEKAMQELIKQGKRAFMKTTSHYFRLRYAYQLIRLAHYAKQYEQALELYDYLMPKTDNDPSLIEYWIEGHKAGALMALGRNVEASYLYSRIFEHAPSKRESAFRSFRIRTDEDWRRVLLMCRDDKERATLYALRANAANSKVVEEMENIYALDPTNGYLELLLVKEMKKLEKDLLGYSFNNKKQHNRRYHNIPRKEAGKLVIELRQFVYKVLEEKKINRPGLWKITEGYLELLAGDYYYAALTFEDARGLLSNDTLKEQLEIFELALKISAYEQLNEKIEKEAAKIKDSNPLYEKYEDFTGFMDDKFALLYRNNGHPGKAFRLHYRLKDLKPNPQMDIIEDLLAVCRKEKPNPFEKGLILKPDGTTIEHDLLDIKATLLLSDYQLEASLETYKEMDRVEWDNYGLFQPFVERIRDCIKCPPLPDTVSVYNKGELIEQLLDLEYRARSEPQNAARLFYKLGLAYYNMSYFGYDWEAMDYFRSGSSITSWKLEDGNNIIPHYYYPFGNRENFDCSRALYFFEKARMKAGNSELGARATFMAAKCEQNEYFVSAARGAQRTYGYFDLLIDNYSDKQFFLTAIQECRYFEAYVTK